jgi:hypothetical protein
MFGPPNYHVSSMGHPIVHIFVMTWLYGTPVTLGGADVELATSYLWLRCFIPFPIASCRY